MKNTMESGLKTYKMDTDAMFGWKLKVKRNYCVIDMKVNGWMVKDMDMVYSTMPMEVSMKVNGSII
jgi:hypothetical protein